MAACTVCGPEATGTEGLSWRKEVVVIVLYAATCPVLQGGQDPGRLTSHPALLLTTGHPRPFLTTSTQFPHL